MAAEFRGMCLINIYAPSGPAKRQEREHFYNSELAYLMRAAQVNILLGGDFNSELDTGETTGHYNYSRALAGLVHGFEMWDVWRKHPVGCAYTHYSPTGATRIDRIYATKELFDRKIAEETVAAAFTDHHAVKLRLALDIPILRRGRGIWKLNTSLLEDAECKAKLRQQWEHWTRQRRLYPESTMWWGRFVKKKFRHFFNQEGAERRRNLREMENFYCECTYDVRRHNRPHEANPLQSEDTAITQCEVAAGDARK
jgi:hypothetical protein